MHRQVRAIAVIGAVLFPASLLADTQFITVECQADQHQQISAPGRLLVTEYSFAYEWSFCPTKRIDSKVSIPISGRVTLARFGQSAAILSSQSTIFSMTAKDPKHFNKVVYSHFGSQAHGSHLGYFNPVANFLEACPIIER